MRRGFVAAALVGRVIGAQSPPDSLGMLAAGIGGTCVTTTSGAGYCWGNFGQVNGTVYRIAGADGQPVRLHALLPAQFNRCGLSVDDEVVCGWSSGGAVEGADGAPRRPPACEFFKCAVPLLERGQLPRPPLRAVATGPNHTCALALTGVAYCWGHNDTGQLGRGTWTPDSTGTSGPFLPEPVAIPELRFSQISAGEMITCGVTVRDNAAYCWGYGQSGSTGDSTVMNTCDGPRPYPNKPCSNAVPTRVLPESLPGRFGSQALQFLRVSAGMRLACGVSTTFEAYCWGNNYRCALGRCRTADSPRAHLIQVPGRVVEVGAGYFHACARTADGRIFCWGNNTGGELGSLTTINAGPDGAPPEYHGAVGSRASGYYDPCFLGGRCSPSPVEVSPGRKWVSLAVGPEHTCALAEDDGGMYCWGGSNKELLGLGMHLVPCDNRSNTWGKGPCQPSPTLVPGLPRLVPPRRTSIEALAAQPLGEPVVSDLMSTRLLVTRREVRVIFPADTSRAWSWPSHAGFSVAPTYEWGVTLGALPGSIELWLGTPRSDSARDFASFAELVAAGKPRLCSGGGAPCVFTGTASVQNRQLTLVFRDSALIARAFAMRPEWFHAVRRRPEDIEQSPSDSIRVEYLAPQIPAPDSVTRARVAAERRKYEESIYRISRQIVRLSGSVWWGDTWIEVGDSAQFRVNDALCTWDFCFQENAVRDSGWTTLDSSIAVAHALPIREAPPARRFIDQSPSVTVVARRPGRTTLRVVGLHGPSDTIAASHSRVATLEHNIVVTAPVERITLSPRPEVIRLGDTLSVSARGFDGAGREIAGLPIPILLREAGADDAVFTSNPMKKVFSKPGRKTIIANFGHRADTITVIAIDPKKP